MKDKDKIKDQLVNELEEMRQRVTELEASENERKQAEEALRKSEEKYRTLIDNIQDGVFIIQDAKMQFVNKAFARMVGYNVKELIGMNFQQLIAPEDLEIVADRYRRRQASEDVPREYEFHMLHKDGKTRVIVNMNVGLVDYRGRVASMGTVKDITERKRAEGKLRESEERYRIVFENTGTATVIIEEDMTISMANTEYEKLTGYTKQEIEGKMKWTEIAVEEDRERMKGYHVKRRKKEEAPTEYEFCLINKHGNRKDIFVIGGIIPGTKRSVASLMDITPRKQAEDALRASEERFRTLAEDAPFGLSIMKPDKTFEYFNPKFTEIFGYTIEDIPNKYIWFEKAYPDKEYRREVISIWEKDTVESIKDREIKPRVFTVRCKEGQDKVTHFRAVVLKDGKQFLTYQDITAQAKAEEALHQSEERYRTLVEESFDGIFVQKEPKIIFANQRLHDMLGYGKGELLGLDHWLVYHPDYQKLTRERAQARMQGEMAPSQYEVKLQRKDGSWFYGEINARAISFEGEPGVQVWVRDTTERKQAEEALKESEERYRILVESSTDAILMMDNERRIVSFNKAFLDLFGYEKNELEGESIRIIHQSDDSFRFFGQTAYPVIDKVGYFRTEWEFVRKDATIIPVETVTSTIKSPDGSKIGSVAIIRDITERKQVEEEKKKLEAQLAQAQRMESLGTLAGGIAHNFNNLLMGIMGNTSLMLLETDPTHPNYKKLNTIEKMVQNGSKLTSQLLGYAREGRYEVRPISFNQLVKDTSDTFDTTRKDIRVHQDLAEDLFRIKADQGQIEQVLLNLYVNAADAMPGGGNLFLKTMNVTHEDMKNKPYTPRPGNYVLLTVRDTGVGIDKKTIERIFDPFFTTKGLAKGTGLGLASVYGIVKAHGGYIDVESEKAHGTTFSIYLPATEKEVKEEMEMLSGEFVKGKETVLLVDDEDMVLDVGVQLLKALGYTVLEAKGGREAVAIYRKNKDTIDIVILDMIMPGMGGGEAYDRMKEINPDVRVLLSSGYSIDGQATEIMKRGCNGFIQKPFNIKGLSQNMREILDNR